MILEKQNIKLGCLSEPYEKVISNCGKMLVDGGYVTEAYIEGMLARDRSFSTAIGNAIAIPHGEKEYKNDILATGLVVCTYPDGIDWNGTEVRLVIGIAARGDEHLEILERIADAFADEDTVCRIAADGDVDHLYSLLVTERCEV